MECKETFASLRGRQGMSQETLAAELGVTRQTVWKWEHGKANPSAENLAAMSRLFGVSADFLLNLSPRPDRQEELRGHKEEEGAAQPKPTGQSGEAAQPEQEGLTARPEQEEREEQSAEPTQEETADSTREAPRRNRFLLPLAAAGAGLAIFVLGIYIGIILSRKNPHGSFPEGILPSEDGYTVNIHTEDGDFYRFKKYGDDEIIWQDEIEPEEIDSSTIEDAPDALVIIED